MMWEQGHDQPPVEFVDDRNLVMTDQPIPQPA
jgi:hypothetical protein